MKPSITSKPLDEATPAEQRAYATNFLNLEIHPDASDADVTATIRQANPNVTDIFVMGEVDTAPAPASAFVEGANEVTLKPEEEPGRLAGSLGKGDPRAIIEIAIIESEDEQGGADVFVGVNGRGWQLKRGVPLDVPWRVVEALDLAEQNIVRHRQDEGHEGEVIERKAKRFPYIFHERPTDAQINDWHKATDHLFCA